MIEISLIIEGSFFHIYDIVNIGAYYLIIYGYLSTIMDVNVKLIIKSEYDMVEMHGKEEIHKAILTKDIISSFTVENIQLG